MVRKYIKRNAFYKYKVCPFTKQQIVDRTRVRQRKKYWAVKMLCLKAYGGEPPKCACCGETEIGFLSLDHMNNDGFMRETDRIAGSLWYKQLVDKGFPKDLGLAVMCYNCNVGRSRNKGVCPHKSPQTIHTYGHTPRSRKIYHKSRKSSGEDELGLF